MADKLHSVKLLPGNEVRYTPDYLYTQYGESAKHKELYYLKGTVLNLRQVGLSAQCYANVAWNNNLTYQVPTEYLELVNGCKKEVSA